MSSSTIRLILSAAVSFVFYFAWSYYANSLVTDDMQLILRSAFLQGALSASITLLFTYLLERVIAKYGNHCISLVLITPILCSIHSKTPQNIAIFQTFKHALNRSAGFFSQKLIPALVIAPLMPIAIQALIVISVNWLNATPNLWLTVAPSILFTAIYGYLYTFSLSKKAKA